MVQPTLHSARHGGEKAKAGKAHVVLQGPEKKSGKDTKRFAQFLSRAEDGMGKGPFTGKKAGGPGTSSESKAGKTTETVFGPEKGNLKKNSGKKETETDDRTAEGKEKAKQRRLPGELVLSPGGETVPAEGRIPLSRLIDEYPGDGKISASRERYAAVQVTKTARGSEKAATDTPAGFMLRGNRPEAGKASVREAGDAEPAEGRKKIDRRTAALRTVKEKIKESAAPPAEERPVQGEPKTAAGEDQKKDPGRETLEIRVVSRNGSDRFSETMRTSEGREQRETADSLFRQFREEGNERIVKSARVILKDRNEGEIRLILKPERLGEVRIRLHLQDNLIAGRIFVENSSVREAFEHNMQDLADAFEQSGFEFAGLDVSVSGGGDDKKESEPPRFIKELRASELERSVPRADLGQYYASHAVNIMA